MDSYYITPPRRTNSLLVGLKRPEKPSQSICMGLLSQNNHAQHAKRRLQYKSPRQELREGKLQFSNAQTNRKNTKPRKLRFPPQQPHMIVSHHLSIIEKCKNPRVHSVSGLSRRYEFDNEQNISILVPQRKRKIRQHGSSELPRKKLQKA